MRLTLSFVRCLLLLVAVCCDAGLHAQDGGVWDVPRVGGETITEPSPEATAMRRYQDFSVSYATGTADISIPLLELPGGSIGVSLGLRYHTGGIKRNDISTGVGLGWSLTGLGQVSRQINGFPDEWRGPSGREVRFMLDYASNDWLYYQQVFTGAIETQYDRYSYNFPGYAGSFMIIDGNIKQLPQTDLIIERIADATNPDATDAFIIKTPDGVKYQFDVKEHISYVYRPTPAAPQFMADKSYNAVSSWNLSLITASQGDDEISISYTPIKPWTRTHNIIMRSDGFSYDSGNYYYGESSQNPFGENYTTFQDQRLPLNISSRSGSIDVTVTREPHVKVEAPHDYIRTLFLKDAAGNVIKTVDFDNSTTHGDGRQRLAAVTVTSDGSVIDKYTLDYHNAVGGNGYDVFGYVNSDAMFPDMSILDHNGKLSDKRRPNFFYATNAALKSITDVSGVTTTLEYEPSIISVDSHNGYSIISGDVAIGLRLKTIRTKCPVTGRQRTRSYSYSDPQCNVLLQQFIYSDFISQSGTCSENQYPGLGNIYNMGITYTASAKTRGFPVENSTIYYGKVTEDLTGTDIDIPIRTEYVYDLSRLRFLRLSAGSESGMECLGPHTPQRPERLDKFKYYSGGVPFINRNLVLSPTIDYIEEHIGATPLLTQKTTYEYVGDLYQPRVVERSYYSETDYDRFPNGAFSECIVFNYTPLGWDTRLNIDCLNDMNYLFTQVSTSRMVCDSTVVTVFYDPVSGTLPSRQVKTVYLNSRSHFKETPGFCLNKSAIPDGKTYKPLGAIISSGNESITNITVPAEYSYDIGAIDCAMRGMRYWPSCEKWFLRTNAGCDSIIRNHEYEQVRLGEKIAMRLRRVSVVSDSKYDFFIYGTSIEQYNTVISSQCYTDYDSRGRITEMIDAQGRRIRAKWMDKYDLLSEMSLPDAGLTTTYTHRPLVGCTSITSPSGRKRSFSYTAGRLTEERNTAGDLVASYAYQLYGDGTASAANRANRFSTTLHDSSGSATDVTYYDGFGMPVQTIATVAGDNLVRSAVTYDALDRPVRQYLPVPADDDSYMTDVSSAAVSHYGDSHPFARMTYRNMAGDKPLEVIREGEKMQDHPERYEYLCNNTTDAMLRCRRYRLAASADSESITLDGDYPAGALDVTRATDPDGCTLLTFTDWRGLTMLERRVVSDTEFADTYYLYDVLGNVRVILQPEGAAQMTATTKTWTTTDDVIDQFAFINRYDRRGNCVYAKVPGAGPVEMRYDPLNRLAFRQTATMAEQNESEFTLYDPIGRPALTGITDLDIPDEKSIPLMTTTLNSSSLGIDGTGYQSPESLDLENDVYNTHATVVNYYDSYNMLSLPGFDIFDEDEITPYANTVAGQVVGTRVAVLDGNSSEPYYITEYQCNIYGYDSEENKIFDSQITIDSNGGTILPNLIVTTYSYTRQHKPIFENINLDAYNDYYNYHVNYSYDASGSIQSESVSYMLTDTLGNTVTANYEYDSLGRMSKRTTGNNQSIRYKYNLRGQISEITSPVFAQTLKYEDGTTPCYNGNISQMSLSYNNNSIINRSFAYDSMNRLTAQTSSDGYNTAYSYNLNSSPLTVLRYGETSDGTIGTVDDLVLTYDGNILSTVNDMAESVIIENSNDAIGGQNHFTYDIDGRQTYISGNDFNIEYAFNHRPMIISGSANKSITYTYDAYGTKISQTTYTRRGNRGVRINTTRIGPFEFKWNSQSKQVLFDRLNLPWGYIDSERQENTYITDYQGNIRAVVDSVGNTVQTTDYYPYGLPMATSTGAGVNRYKYSGKEYDTSIGLNFHDFEARMLFNDHTLFGRPDDNAGKYPHLNPYLYCAANPLRYIDPTGEDIWRINEKGEVVGHEVTEEFDRFDFVDNDGRTIVNDKGEEQSITMEYGTVKNYRNEKYVGINSEAHGSKSGSVDIFEIKGDVNATKLFEMFANNVTMKTSNEIGMIRTGKNGEKSPNFIVSGHQPKSEPGTSVLINGQLQYGYYIREIIHSHPDDDFASVGDFLFKSDIQNFLYDKYKYCTSFMIYHCPSKRYIKF